MSFDAIFTEFVRGTESVSADYSEQVMLLIADGKVSETQH